VDKLKKYIDVESRAKMVIAKNGSMAEKYPNAWELIQELVALSKELQEEELEKLKK